MFRSASVEQKGKHIESNVSLTQQALYSYDDFVSRIIHIGNS